MKMLVEKTWSNKERGMARNDVVGKFMQFDFGNAMYTGGPVEAI